MRIESGTTTEHRVRLGIFLAMCAVFAAYFGYDGMWGYPAKNRDWAVQNIPNLSVEQREAVATNPKVMMQALAQLDADQRSGVITMNEVKARLGEPAATMPADAGSPDAVDHWYVGPAACAELKFSGGKLRQVRPLENISKTESDIHMQKVLGAILAVVSLAFGVHYVRVMTMKTILDDEGLTAKGSRIAWDQMRELDACDYQRKGWLDLVYGSDGEERTVRLDSYHIAAFDEIVNTICERKGFDTPIKPRSPEHAESEEV